MDRRTCVTCRFYQRTRSFSLGQCGHPDRMFRGITPLVRAGELGCRRGFDADDWVPALIGGTQRAEDILLSERPAPFRSPLPFPHVPASEPETLSKEPDQAPP